MAKRDMLDDIESITTGADMKETKTTGKVEMKKKQIIIPAEWDNKIRELVGRNTSGYILNAVKKTMIEDKIL
ncbi:MAG TPA: hypothetical protein EYG83_03605 [Sulfurospirillum arcachonense]|nr:hypothetical protein [Sulfurospirillum arcachonense]